MSGAVVVIGSVLVGRRRVGVGVDGDRCRRRRTARVVRTGDDKTDDDDDGFRI